MAAKSESRTLGLASHVHACCVDGNVILLDLKSDQYLAVAATDVPYLATVVDGWPIGDACSNEATDARQLLETMLAAGILTSGGHRPLLQRERLEPATTAAIDGYTTVESTTTVVDGVRFLRAVVTARFLMRFRPLIDIVGHVRARRPMHVGHAQNIGCDVKTLRQLTSKFVRMRTFLFTAADQCLVDSLILLEFLGSYGVFPRWIFGVTATPFAAHCWVQDRDVVLNDIPEHVGRFTPIMVV